MRRMKKFHGVPASSSPKWTRAWKMTTEIFSSLNLIYMSKSVSTDSIRTTFIMEPTSSARQRTPLTPGLPPTASNQPPPQQQAAATSNSSRISLQQPRSHFPSPRTLLFLLLTISLTGSLLSLYLTNPAITSFRSRLPAPYLTTSSHPSGAILPRPDLPYFANKSNLLNQWFVKKGWGWTSALWAIFVGVEFVLGSSGSSRGEPSRTGETRNGRKGEVLKDHLRRYALATTYWFYLTQATWFLLPRLSPSISHHLLLLSGAQCYPSSFGSAIIDAQNGIEAGSGGVCSGAKGEYWKGGHDVSGHTFLLIHSVLLLYSTILPTLRRSSYFTHPSLTSSSSTSSSSGPPSPSTPQALSQSNSNSLTSPVNLASIAVLTLIVLWNFMLWNTSLYFHTPLEKFTGALFAVVGWAFSELGSGRQGLL